MPPCTLQKTMACRERRKGRQHILLKFAEWPGRGVPRPQTLIRSWLKNLLSTGLGRICGQSVAVVKILFLLLLCTFYYKVSRELSQNCQARNETDANATFATSLQCLQILSQNQQTVKTLDSTAHRVPKVSCGRSISETVDAGVSRVEEAHRRQLMQSWSYHQRTI